jgi:hypothetical protein
MARLSGQPWRAVLPGTDRSQARCTCGTAGEIYPIFKQIDLHLRNHGPGVKR